jgi:hypothetical protein
VGLGQQRGRKGREMVGRTGCGYIAEVVVYRGVVDEGVGDHSDGVGEGLLEQIRLLIYLRLMGVFVRDRCATERV